MAKDDYFVIAYRLLKYLYDCLKKSGRVNRDAISADFFGIGDDYWEYIMRNLCADGYIEGVTLVPISGKADDGVKINANFRITPKGILHLEENSIFRKIKGAVKDIADIAPL